MSRREAEEKETEMISTAIEIMENSGSVEDLEEYLESQDLDSSLADYLLEKADQIFFG